MQIGADPEFIVRDPSGKPVPAYKFFPREKKLTRLEGPNSPKSFEGFFRDGFALEVNGDPDLCQSFMQDSIRGALRGAQKVLPEGYYLDTCSAVPCDPIEASGPSAPEDTKTFGCSPSKNAYEGSSRSPEIDAATHPFRYAGGHLHWSVRLTPETFRSIYPGEEAHPWETMPDSMHLDGPYQHVALPENHPLLVKWLDRNIGLPLSVLQARIPEVFARRQFYGRAGEYRSQWYEGGHWREPVYPGESLQHYTRFSAAGIEYRVPGSELWRHNALVSIFTRIGRWTLKNFPKLPAWDPSIEPELRGAIDLGVGAEALLRKLDPKMAEVILYLREVKELSTFRFPKQNGHTGFDEAVQAWGLGEILPSCPQMAA